MAVTLYCQIDQWCNSVAINLPERNFETIKYGVFPINDENCLVNHLLLRYKMILLGNRKNTQP